MTLKLTLHDRKGVELNEGDIVKISDGTRINFYSEVKYNEQRKCIYPFHVFSFHSVEKVDDIPEDAVLSSETDFRCWYIPTHEIDKKQDDFEHYLMSWRECERLLEHNYFRIEKI